MANTGFVPSFCLSRYAIKFVAALHGGVDRRVYRGLHMHADKKRSGRQRARAVTILFALTALTIFAPRAGIAQQDEFDRFRNTLIDYFKRQSYFPVLVNRGYAVGDVLNVDGVNFYARAARCFPRLQPPSPVAAALADVVETDSVGMSFGLQLKQLFDSSVGADLARRIRIKFLDVTMSSVALLDLRDALDRQRCPDIAPLIDGTITPVDRNQKPFFVVSEVVYGKREADLQLKAGAGVQAEAERLGRQIGDAHLKMTASADGLVTLTSDVVAPIAVRPCRSITTRLTPAANSAAQMSANS